MVLILDEYCRIISISNSIMLDGSLINYKNKQL